MPDLIGCLLEFLSRYAQLIKDATELPAKHFLIDGLSA